MNEDPHAVVAAPVEMDPKLTVPSALIWRRGTLSPVMPEVNAFAPDAPRRASGCTNTGTLFTEMFQKNPAVPVPAKFPVSQLAFWTMTPIIDVSAREVSMKFVKVDPAAGAPVHIAVEMMAPHPAVVASLMTGMPVTPAVD